MKRILSAIALSFSLVAPLAAQTEVVFKEPVQDAGEILWQQPRRFSFTFTNKTTRSIRIQEVLPDCGCTVATWTEGTIQPGAEGAVQAVFDAELLGHFRKQVAVLLDGSEAPVYLTLSGKVVAEKTEDPTTYSYTVGHLLVNTDNIEFDDVNRGDRPTKSIYIYNSGQETYRPQLMHLPKYLTAMAIPAEIRPGRKGEIVLTLDSRELPNMGLNQTSIYLSRRAGDRVGKDNELNVSVTLLPQFGNLPKQMEYAPVARIDSVLDLTAQAGKTKAKGELTLTNAGKTVLEVQTLQVYNPGVSVSLGKRRLAAGESTKLKVNVDRTAAFKGRHRILLITNDPRRSKTVIDVLLK